MLDDENKDTRKQGAAPALSARMKAFEDYLNKPVAVQLKAPIIGIDAMMDRIPETGKLPTNERGESVLQFVVTDGLGWPMLAPQRGAEGKIIEDSNGVTKPKMEVVLFGSLRAAPCGTRLVLIRQSDLGARLATLIAPDNIDYITTIVGVPPPEAIPGSGLISKP